jgi:hypothetical protein
VNLNLKQKKSEKTMNELPNEILHHILKQLYVQSLCACSLTSKLWHEVSNEYKFQKIYSTYWTKKQLPEEEGTFFRILLV